MLVFSHPNLKGRVEFNNGKTILHGDPETKYMKHLLEEATNWYNEWIKTDKPDIECLSDEARKIVESVEPNKFGLEGFTERIKKQIEKGNVDHEYNLELWRRFIGHDSDYLSEAANYLYEQQLYQILRED